MTYTSLIQTHNIFSYFISKNSNTTFYTRY